jgi:hypothetical protein
MRPLTGGVAGIELGTLVPGDKELVFAHVGPDGGRRYGWEVLPSHGLTILREERNHKNTAADILALIEAPDWFYGWRSFKDGALVGCSILTSEGEHQYSPEGEYGHTNTWEWASRVLQPDADLFFRAFGKQSNDQQELEQELEAKTSEPETKETPTLESLQQRFNKQRIR